MISTRNLFFQSFCKSFCPQDTFWPPNSEMIKMCMIILVKLGRPYIYDDGLFGLK